MDPSGAATTPGAPTSPAPPAWALAAVLVLAAWAAYAVALPGEFVFDDIDLIQRNATLKHGLDLGRIFSAPYHADEGYRPVSVCLLALEYSCYRLEPLGYHVTNLLLHALNAILVFLVARRLLASMRTAFWAALLFAVHPVHGEVVANIAQRDALLSFCFYLLAWLSYLRGGALGLGGALVAYFLGLLSKEDCITLPAALFLGDLVRGLTWDRRSLVRAAARYAAFAFPLLLCILLRLRVLHSPGAGGHLFYFADTSRLVAVLTVARFVLRHYLTGLLYAGNISFDYARPSLEDVSPADPLAWVEAAVLLAGAVAAFTLLLRRRSPAALGIAFVFVTLLPVSNLIFPIWAIGAERYLYLPSLGYCLAVAVGIHAARARVPHAVAAAEVGLVVVYLALAVIEAAPWREGITLYRTMLDRTPRNPSAHVNLALELQRRGRLDEALALYAEAVRLDPEDIMAEVNRAAIYSDRGEYEAALGLLRRVQGHGRARRELPWIGGAEVLRRQKKYGEARSCLAQALAEEPACAAAFELLGRVAMEEGKEEEAERHLRRALEIDPDLWLCAYDLATLLRRRKAEAEAVPLLRTVVALRPAFWCGWGDLGLALEATGDFAAAELAYRAAIAAAPREGAPHHNLGILLARVDRWGEAVEEFSAALAVEPTLVEARLRLGIALAKLGQREHAEAEWREFLKAAGDDPRQARAVEMVRRELKALERHK